MVTNEAANGGGDRGRDRGRQQCHGLMMTLKWHFLLQVPPFPIEWSIDFYYPYQNFIATTIATRRCDDHCDDHCDKTLRQDDANNNYDKTMWQYNDQLILLCTPLRQLSRRQIATILPTKITTQSRQQDATIIMTKQCDKMMRQKLRLKIATQNGDD